MRTFKKIVASVISYLMITMILPTELFEKIANATTEVPKFMEVQDFYLQSEAQYKDKVLYAYRKINEADNTITTKLVIRDNGNEKILKEYTNASQGENFYIDIQNTKSEIVKVYTNKTIYASWETTQENFEYDFSTGVLKEVELSDNEDSKPNINVPITDEFKTTVLQKINAKYNKEYKINDNMSIVAYNQIINDIKYILYYCHISPEESYNGMYSESFDILTKGQTLQTYFDKLDQSLYIIENEEIKDEKIIKRISKLNNGKLESPNVLELPIKDRYSQIEIVKDFLVVKSNVVGEKLVKFPTQNLSKYIVKDNKYELVNTYDIAPGLLQLTLDMQGNVWFLTDEGGNRFVQQLNNEGLVKRYEISQIADCASQIHVYDENNMIVATTKGTIFINNKIVDDGNDSDNNGSNNGSGDGDNTGGNNNGDDNGNNTGGSNNGDNNGNNTGGNSNNGGNTSTPGVDVVPEQQVTAPPSVNGFAKVEIETLSPNNNNTIKATIDGATKEVHLAFKNVEAIKSGTGSLTVSVNDLTNINLPFSAIDKNLLEGAKAVNLVYSEAKDSEIIKGFKAVNKVFNFNLVVEKENGTTSIHNFSNGLAEIKLTLTDDELKSLNKDKLAVFYYNETTKSFEMMETKVEGNVVTFKTPHFSSYVVAEKSTASNTVEKVETLPDTGALVNSYTILVIGLIMLIAGASLNIKKQEKIS